jgi:hypothetical protein
MKRPSRQASATSTLKEWIVSTAPTNGKPTCCPSLLQAVADHALELRFDAKNVC